MTKEIVVITGTSSGFGFLTSLHLAKKGYYVIATMRNIIKKDRLINEAKRLDVLQNIEIFKLDVNNQKDIENLVQYIDQTYGKLDILINNAGYCLGGMIEYAEVDEWEHQLQTNVLGVLQVTKAFIPMMRRVRKGKIINVGSISGRFGFPGLGAYTTSKFALSGFSESLRLELSPFDIKVSIIEPGSFKTDIWEKSFKNIEVTNDRDYELYMNKILDQAKNTAKKADDPLKVVNLIDKICKSKKPKLRYPIGKGIKLMLFMKAILPWFIIEKIATKKISKS